MATVLIIGVRRPCYKAALVLGHDVILWSDGPLHPTRKRRLTGWLEQPYESCEQHLSPEVFQSLNAFSIDTVIANTEEAVVLGARVRHELNLARSIDAHVDRFHHKYVMKQFAQRAGIPVTPFRLITEHTSAREVMDQLRLPVVVKPIGKSGAQGIQMAHTEAELQRVMILGHLAEAYVEGSELSVETFIHDGYPIFHNITRYVHPWKTSVLPAQLDPQTQEAILTLNDRIIQKFGVDRGMTHAEFYVTAKGILFGEIALRPPGGYYMPLIQKAYGFDPWKTYVQLECGQHPGPLPQTAKSCAAVYMIHPGRGRVSSVSGLDDIQRLPGLFEFKVRLQPGDEVAAHEATSNERGHILLAGDSEEDLLGSLRFIEAHLRVDMTADPHSGP